MTEENIQNENKPSQTSFFHQGREILLSRVKRSENASNEAEKLPWWIILLTWIFRIAGGGVFLFSGFVKAIDPWGTIYKVNDYLAAMDLAIWPNVVLVGVFCLCAIEFLTGVFIIMGCFRRASAWLMLAIMCFMLPLTLWIAVSDPVADCGCFGDAVVITNWQTFWKNVVLTMIALWLCLFQKKTYALITPALQWLAFVASGAYITVIALVGYGYQPLLDFRAYPVGSTLVDNLSDAASVPVYEFIYRKGNETKVFGENDELPDEADGWEYVDRKEISSPQPADVSESDFRIYSVPEGEDVTETALSPEGNRLILFSPSIKDVSVASTWKINSLCSWAKSHDMDFIAVVAGSEMELDNWDDLSMPDYEIFTTEDTVIKQIVRGNPAIVYLEDGVIKWKSTLNSIPVDDFLQPGTSDNAMVYSRDNRVILRNISMVFITIMAVFVVFSILPYRKIFGSGRRKESDVTDAEDSATEDQAEHGDSGSVTDDDTVRREE